MQVLTSAKELTTASVSAYMASIPKDQVAAGTGAQPPACTSTQAAEGDVTVTRRRLLQAGAPIPADKLTSVFESVGQVR